MAFVILIADFSHSPVLIPLGEFRFSMKFKNSIWNSPVFVINFALIY